ncbi:creatine kinase, putative [Bodo saltans]|uniref:Creatine kinase, putative n=1 Tax=Bodo saltans TaxID=75058 RepID=A0A0S4J280_BODSA|nr:creatine kinase, putative [Bodo saltans]|eukprot:CUG84376.1 creatine kinase, putative [Bodo saltans]
MDASSVYLQHHKVPELIDKLVLLLVSEQPANAKQYLKEKLEELIEARFEGDAATLLDRTLPPLNPRATIRPVLVAKFAGTADVYRKLGKLRTSLGVSLDDCLRGGIEYHTHGDAALTPANPPYGLLMGDGESYQAFSEVLDATLGARIGGAGLQGPGGKTFMAPKSELGSGPITSGFQFPEKYVVGAGVKLARNIATFRMSCCTTRAERRELARIVQAASLSAFQGSSSTSGSIKAATLAATDPLLMDLRIAPAIAPEDTEPWLRPANIEWPDARHSFVSHDNVFFVNVLCGTEHVEIASKAVRSHDVRDAFERVAHGARTLEEALRNEDGKLEWQNSPKYGNLMSNLDHLYGGGMMVHFILRLPLLAAHPNLTVVLNKLKLQQVPAHNYTKSCQHPPTEVVAVRNKTDEKPYSVMEADLVQLCCASVSTLIELEEVLQTGGHIEGRY